MSFDVPAGNETTSELAYEAGRIARDVRAKDAAWVHVRWSFGPELADPPKLIDLARAISKGLRNNPGEAHAVPGGVPATFALDKANHDLITLFRCGGRNVMLITTGAGDLLHARIGKTFACHPDPAREAASLEVPLHIDLPGFRAVDRSPGLLALDDGHSVVTLQRQATAPMTTEQVDRAAPDLLRTAGYENVVTKRSDDLLTFTGTLQGTPRAGLIRIVNCPGLRVQIKVDSEPESYRDLEILIRAARCLKPDEPAPTWPDATP